MNLIGTALRKCLRNLLVHSLTVIRMYAVNNHAINGTVKFIIGIAQIGQKEVIDIVERKAWLQISAYHAAGNTLSKNVQRPKAKLTVQFGTADRRRRKKLSLFLQGIRGGGMDGGDPV